MSTSQHLPFLKFKNLPLQLHRQFTIGYFQFLLPISSIVTLISSWGLSVEDAQFLYVLSGILGFFSLSYRIFNFYTASDFRVFFGISLILFIVSITVLVSYFDFSKTSRHLAVAMLLGPPTVLTWSLIFADKPKIGRWLAICLSMALTLLTFVWQGSFMYDIAGTVTAPLLMLFACFIMLYHAEIITNLNDSFLEGRLELHRDPLTGLHNRRAFEEWSQQYQQYSDIDQSTYYDQTGKTYQSKSPHTGGHIAIIDIDFFKKINDRFGHSTGDRILRSVAQVIQDVLRAKEAQIYRWGGEEFVAFIHGLNQQETYELLESLRKIVESSRFLEDQTITISIGISYWYPTENLQDAFERADRALFAAKSKGRNRLSSHYPKYTS